MVLALRIVVMMVTMKSSSLKERELLRTLEDRESPFILEGRCDGVLEKESDRGQSIF